MPNDTDPGPGDGWMFWTFLAVAAAVTVGASIVTDRWWVTVLGMFAVYGALHMAIDEILADRETAARAAVRAENDRIRTAMRDAARARLEQLDREQP